MGKQGMKRPAAAAKVAAAKSASKGKLAAKKTAARGGAGHREVSAQPQQPWWRTAWARFYGNRALFWSVVIVGAWRAALELYNQLMPLLITPKVTPVLLLHAERWVRWDSGWYLDIALNGYHHIHIASGQEDFAFFPAFPMAIRYLAKFLHVNPVYVGLVVNVLLTVLAAYLIYKIAEWIVEHVAETYRRGLSAELVGVLSIALLLLYPASFFFAAFYAEGFLLVGVLGAVYFALQGRLWWAVPFMALATATKSLGLVTLPVVGVIILEQWWQHRDSWWALIRRWLIVPFGLLGLLGYMVFLKLAFGDPLLFYKIEQGWGRNTGQFFVRTLVERYYVHWLHPHYFGTMYDWVLYLFIMASPFLLLAFAGWVAWRFRTFWPLVLTFGTLLLPLSTGVMQSLNRYELAIAPMFVYAAMIMARWRRWQLLASLACLAVVLLGFTLGYLQGVLFAG